MHLGKALDHLRCLKDEGPDDLSKFSKAEALLNGFERENRGPDGSIFNIYYEEKITTVRSWFAMLCGIGEDGYPQDKIRSNLMTDIGKLKGILSGDELGLALNKF